MYMRMDSYTFIVLIAIITITVIWLVSLYRIHKSIDKLVAVQIAQNDLLKELVIEKRINATNNHTVYPYETDKQRQI